MPRHRERAVVVGNRRARRIRERLGTELHTIRLDFGLSQAQLARRTEIAQSVVSDIERGRGNYSLEIFCRLASAVGHEASVPRLFPIEGVSLRDSGQLELARVVIHQAHALWTPRLEDPVGDPPDRRAADLLLLSDLEALHIEIIRTLFDFQAQLRRERLKQQSLALRLDVPVRLLLAFPDRASVRRVVAAYADLVRAALPMGSPEAWRSIRTGKPLGGDGILWIPTRKDRQPVASD